METDIIDKLPKSRIRRIINDPVKSAEAINLVYISDNSPGISRKKAGRAFCYYLKEKKISDKETLARIRGLVLPPAWQNVWICSLPNGHLQATGLDARSRKQYKYHPLWNNLRNQTKFYRMLNFGKALPAMRKQLESDLKLPGMPQEKVMAAIVSLMERTNIRVGNSVYEKLYGSFGLTTLKNKHVEIKGSSIRFSFVGKKGIRHDISLKNKRLARIVSSVKEIPGKELFQYYDEDGNRKPVDSGMVNDYIKKISGEDFTAKDFRTWAGTVNAFIALKELGLAENETTAKKMIVEALDKVASNLGNSRTICKKYYVHPVILSMYENHGLKSYFKQPVDEEDDSGLSCEEKIIMKILEKS